MLRQDSPMAKVRLKGDGPDIIVATFDAASTSADEIFMESMPSTLVLSFHLLPFNQFCSDMDVVSSKQTLSPLTS